MKTMTRLGRWLTTALSLAMSPACLSQATETVTYYYTNQQGTPLATADASGNILTTSDYQPYGSQVLGSTVVGPGYTGHVNDADSGLVYMQARYYDPVIGRFMSTDPNSNMIARVYSFGRYVYANDNPVGNIDPNGKETIAIGFSGIAANQAGGTGSSQITFSMSGWHISTFRIGTYWTAGGIATTAVGNLGGAISVSISQADSAEEMERDGGYQSVGGSATIQGINLGYDQNVCSGCVSIRTISLGIRVNPATLPEIHTSMTVSGGTTWIGSKPVFPTVTVGPVQPPSPPPLPVPKKDDTSPPE